MYIAIAGNIGSGKTSLTGILAERTGARAYYEDSDNPYIGDFYEDMNRWSFNLQIYFLGQRIREAAAILSEGADLIQDRTIYEDAYIFASNLHGLGSVSYTHLTVPTLVKQIKKRGRAYEASIQEGYLEQLNRKYEEWINNIYQGEVMTIDVDTVNFIENPSLLDGVVARIAEFKTRGR